MNWSAGQYSKFEAERNRPIFDLLAQLPAGNVLTAADIGCGPGNSTELLKAKFPEARVTAIDSSDDMVRAARERLPNVKVELADIATWAEPGPLDVILANASLQWVPDHSTVLPRLIAKLAPGGSLAVQTPDNLDEPAHRLMRSVAAEATWAEKIGSVGAKLPPRHTPDWYYRLLRSLATSVDIWRTTYYHPLAGGANGVVEWFKGTGLRPFLAPLSQAEQAGFLAKYEAEIAAAYPALADGTVILPFPRLFYVVTR